MFSPIFEGFQSCAVCEYLCAVQAAESVFFAMAARMVSLLQLFELVAGIADLQLQAWGKHKPFSPLHPTSDARGPCLTALSLEEGRRAGLCLHCGAI